MDGGKRSKLEDNIGMLEQLRTVDPLAASRFLEHLILQKRSDVRADDGSWPSWSAYHLSYRIGGCTSSLRTCAWTSYLITSPMTLSRNSGGRKVDTWWFLFFTPLTWKPSLWISEKHYPDFFPLLFYFDDTRLGAQADSTENDLIPPSFCASGPPGGPV